MQGGGGGSSEEEFVDETAADGEAEAAEAMQVSVTNQWQPLRGWI
jgi:hypothetical protein